MGLPFIAGLGQGLSSLGNDIQNTQLRQIMLQRQAMLDKEQRDAQTFNELMAAHNAGGTILPAGQDPTQALANLNQGRDMVSNGALLGPVSAAAGNLNPASNQFGAPSIGTLGSGQHILFNPDQSPQALMMKRQETVAAQRGADAEAKQDKKDADAAAAAALKVKTQAQADYNAIKLNHPDSPFVQQPFDENDQSKWANYAGERARLDKLDEIKLQGENAIKLAQTAKPVNDNWVESKDLDAQGNPIWVNTRNMQTSTLAGAKRAPTGTGGAQAGKARDYVNMIGQSLPTMEQLSDQVDSNHIALAIEHPTLANLAVLTEPEKLYMAAANNALAGVAHQESGARLSKEQWAIGQQRFFPNANDSPAVKRAKLATLRTLYEERLANTGGQEAAAPPAPTGGGGRGGVNPDQHPGNINLAGGAGPSAGLTPAQVARAQSDPQYAAFLKATGKTP